MGDWLTDNMGWIAGLFGAGGGGAVVTRVYARHLDHRRDSRRQTDEVAMGLVTRLEARVEKLEASIEQERQKCDAELGVHRHRINNQRTIIYSLFHLFDVPAAKRKLMLESVRSELAAMEQAEALEKGIIAAAPLVPAPPAA